jgi:flagellar hook-associated protein 1
MGSLLNSLVTVAESMRATQLAIEVGGNNVANAKTPGFAKQRLDLLAKRFEPNVGFAGGVAAGSLLSGRKVFLEQGVQEQSHRHGRFSQQTANLERIEPIFDVASNSGIGGAVDRLFESFSSWSVNPNDTPARLTVLDRARDLAQSFRFTVTSLATVKADAQTELRSTVERINRIGQEIQQYNLEVRSDVRKLEDPGLDAQLFQQLESLAELVDFDVIRAEDGSFAVNLGGQTSIAVGAHFYPVSLDFSGPAVEIRNAQGGAVTGQLGQGRVRAQLDLQNGFLPALTSDLDRLARNLADSVNTGLGAGLDRDGSPPAANLFSYDATAGVAASLTVNGLDASELAAASSGAPGGNGNALALADLARARSIDDFTPSQFYGNLAGRVGRALANSRNDETTQALLLSQSKHLRAAASEVSLDEEAANLVAFQRQYEANAELIRILNSLTETTLNIIR